MSLAALADVALADVAAGAPLDLELAGDGTPARPVLFVDVAEAASLAPGERAAAAAALRDALPVTVGLADGSVVAPELLEALSLTLASGSACGDRRVVAAGEVGAADAADLAARLRAAGAAAPRATVALGRLVRQTAVLDVPGALCAESAVYSTLLAGPEFARWVGERRPARPPVPGAVRVSREGDLVHIELDRAARRNAVDTATRDALVDALALLADPDVRIELTGAGPDFSAGGDLDEFGTAPDPATAHVVRLEQSAGRRIAADADRITAYVHGACVGAGCELPAFAGRVVAAPGSWFLLPELSLGLVPGAGGTVSVTRRVGRWRSAWMALTGARVDAATAVAWGLADEIGERMRPLDAAAPEAVHG